MSKEPETLTFRLWQEFDVWTLMIPDTAANADRKKIGPLCRQRCSIMQYYLKNNFKVFKFSVELLYFLPRPTNELGKFESRANTTEGLVFRIFIVLRRIYSFDGCHAFIFQNFKENNKERFSDIIQFGFVCYCYVGI